MLTPTTRPPREFEYTFIPDDSADTQWNAFPHGIQMRMLAVWRAQGIDTSWASCGIINIWVHALFGIQEKGIEACPEESRIK